MQRAIIVRRGNWGNAIGEDYTRFIEHVQRSLEDATIGDPTDLLPAKAAEVQVVDTPEEAVAVIQKSPINMAVDVVVFISRGMEKAAEEMAARYPNVRVVVFTGVVPEGKVIWASKMAIRLSRDIQNVILH